MPDVIIQPTPSNSAPQMPSTPPPEVLKQTFTMDPSLLAGGDETQVTIDHKPLVEEKPVVTTTEKVVEPKLEVKKEEPKVEVKKEEKKSVLKAPEGEKKEEKVVESKKEIIKPVTLSKEKKEEDTFDYTKYSPQEVTNLKNMSRQSREYVAKMIDENKQLANLKDSNYLQHEQGYTLSPDYQNLQVAQYKAQVEGQCWEKSLLDIKAGKDYQEIVGFDKNNNPVLSAPKKATDRDEIRVANNLSLCINAAQAKQGELQQFPNQFKQRIQQDQQAINQYEREHFEWVANPALLEHSVEIDGVGDKKVKDIISDITNMFPVYDRNSNGARMCAHLAVSLIIRNAELKEARNGQQVAQIKQQEAARGEPSSDSREVAPAKEVNGVKEFSLGNIGEQLGLR